MGYCFLNGCVIKVWPMNSPDEPSSPDCPRWQRRPSERPREILDAAVLVFGERGFDSATIAEVARRAGVSPGTVVHYFGSKGELFEAALNERFLRDVADGEALLAGHRGPYRELLRALLTQMWTQLMEPGTAELMLFGLTKAQNFPEATACMCREIGERYRRLMAGVLEAGAGTGEFRVVPADLQARVISGCLLGVMLKARHFSQFEQNPPDPDALLAQFLDTIDHALGASQVRVPAQPGHNPSPEMSQP
jgi:AcrR family transcriptional regulator